VAEIRRWSKRAFSRREGVLSCAEEKDLPVRKKNSLLGKQKVFSGVYLNRAFGSNRHHYAVDVDVAADTTAGQQTGKGGYLSGEPQTVGNDAGTVLGG